MGSNRTPRRSMQPMHPTRTPEGSAHQPLSRPWPGFAGSLAYAPTLASVLDPNRNSFSALRLIMALAVLISHAVFLATGSFSDEPLVAWTGYSLGQYGVQGFFILSGIVVSQSLMQRGDFVDYGRARAMRIFPALIVCVLVTVLVIGPQLTVLGTGTYFKSTGVVVYMAKTLSLSTGSATLPGVFDTNPAAGVVNQSLWTLKYEVSCYLLLGLIAALIWRARDRRRATMIAVGAWALLILAMRPNLTHGGNFLETLTYFTLFFGTGVAAYLMADKIRLGWQPLVALGVLFAVSIETQFAEISSALFVGYGLLWLATWRFGALRAFANSNDYSYGTYIYSYPVTQVVLALWPGIHLLALIIITLGVTLLLTMLSWNLIERPALDLVRGWRTGTVKTAAPPTAKAASPTPSGATPAWKRPRALLLTAVATSDSAPVSATSPLATTRLRARIAKLTTSAAVSNPLP